MNRAILIGRLVRDPELRTTQNGISVCSFTLAIDRRFKNKYGERETDFIPCVAWSKTAEFCAQYFSQGQRLALLGNIQPRSWEDQDGNRRYTTEVIAEEIYFADGKREQMSSAHQIPKPSNTAPEPQSESEMIPLPDNCDLPWDI